MSSSSRNGVVPPPALAALARQAAEKHGGMAPAARTLGISRAALAALAAGFRVRRGTIVLVAQALKWPGDERASSAPPPPPEHAA